MSEAAVVALEAGTHLIGLATGRCGRERCTAVVLPKVWRRRPPRTTVISWDDGPLALVLHEQDRVVVRVEGGDARRAERRAALLELVAAAEREAAGPDEPDDAPVPLLSLCAERGGAVEATPDPVPAAVEALVLLVEGAHGGVGLAGRREERHPILEALVQRRLVDGVRARLSEIRRRYVAQEDRLAALRGQVDVPDLAQALARGSRELRCRHEVFTLGSPLLRVVVTALDVVASSVGLVLAGIPGRFGRGLQEDAVALRRQLGEIQSLPFTAASRAAATLRLPRQEGAWRPVLDLARTVLERSARVLDPTLAPEAGEAWSVSLSGVWERLVVRALSHGRQGEERVEYFEALRRGTSAVLAEVPPPWAGLGSPRRPDVVALLPRDGGALVPWVLDAKYKLRLPGAPPSRDDQLQLFAYAHLARGRNGAPVRDLALVYPSHGGRTGCFGMSGGAGVRLHVVEAPFPGVRDVTDAAGWEAWVARASGALREGLGLGAGVVWERDAGPARAAAGGASLAAGVTGAR